GMRLQRQRRRPSCRRPRARLWSTISAQTSCRSRGPVSRMSLNSTSPLYQSAKLRLDPKSGTLRSQQYVVIVESGPDKGKQLKLEGTLFVGSSPDCGL